MNDRVINVLTKLAIALGKKSDTVYVTYCPSSDNWNVMSFSQVCKKTALLDMSDLRNVEPQVRQFVIANAKKLTCPTY